MNHTCYHWLLCGIDNVSDRLSVCDEPINTALELIGVLNKSVLFRVSIHLMTTATLILDEFGPFEVLFII